MITDKNDPKLTAYVLGELTEDEAKEVETAIENDPALKQEVDEIRKTVSELETAFKNETLNREPPTVSAHPKRKSSFYRFAALAAAACLLFITVYAVQHKPETAKRNNQQILVEKANSPLFLLQKPSSDSETSDKAKAASDERLNADAMQVLSERRKERYAVSEQYPADKKSVETVEKQREMAEGKPVSGNLLSSPYGVHGATGSATGGENMTFAQPLADACEPAPRSEASLGKPLFNPFPATPAQRAVPAEEPMKAATRGRVMERGDMAMGGGMGGRPAAQGVMMMVTPQVIIQEEEEDSLSVTGKVLADPYNNEKSETYKNTEENPFKVVKTGEFSTFSIDVDTASYGMMRRVIQSGQKVPENSVRIEEFINYFNYDYAAPIDGKPFAVHTDVAKCPWEPKHLLAKIGIKGKDFEGDERPPLNLVFLVDVSGSMEASNRL
ncbi:MAG: von Willebrand factor type A domain-containing protein, partial [Planctomycetaceae bacterium]|nr:von Willebrand factor type A domain-containing protein [Planctomycetaceae bacterium]